MPVPNVAGGASVLRHGSHNMTFIDIRWKLTVMKMCCFPFAGYVMSFCIYICMVISTFRNQLWIHT